MRNCVGYAIQKITPGTIDNKGVFTEVTKALNEKLTTYSASSINPWHSGENF